MEAAIRRRILRAPPPTPIATGKGSRSAAVDDRVLTQYLETSLRVPDLALPKPYTSKSPIAKTLTKLISLSALVSGQDASVGEMMAAAAAEIGAFSIDAGDPLAREDVRDLIEVGREVAGSGEEKEMVLGEGVNEEAYRIFREKTEKVTTKLEMVAESIAKILSEHVKNQRHTATLQKVYSVVCLRRHGDSYRSSEDAALSLHITGSNHKFRVQSPQSTSFTLPSCCLLVTVGKQLEVIAFCVQSPQSTSFTLPSCCLLVTVGKQLEEFCNGELKSFDGQISLDPSSEQLAPISLEFMYSLPVLNRMPSHCSSKTLSIMDQLLILLILAFLYNLWS